MPVRPYSDLSPGNILESILQGGQRGLFPGRATTSSADLGRAAGRTPLGALLSGAGEAGDRLSGRAVFSPSTSSGKGRSDSAARALKGRSNAGMGPKGQQPSALEQLLEQMQGFMGDSASYGVDTGAMRGQIEQAINPVYDARIAAIRQLMGQAEERVGEGREDIEGMYNQLSGMYMEDAEEAEARLEEARQEAAGLADQLTSNIEGTYTRITDDQEELFKSLGIERALEETQPELAEDQAWLEGLAQERGAANEDYYSQLGASDQAYYAQGAPLAKLEGSNRSADLLSQLEQYMAQQSAGITELEGQRASEIGRAMLDMQSQAQSQAASQRNNQWGRMMDMFGILQGMQPEQQNQEDILTGPQQIAQSIGLPPEQNQQFMGSIDHIIGTYPEVLSGQLEDPQTGTVNKITPARLRQIVSETSNELGLSPAVAQALLLWADRS